LKGYFTLKVLKLKARGCRATENCTRLNRTTLHDWSTCFWPILYFRRWFPRAS